MEQLLRQLLATLGRIGEIHPELYDSDVREAMRNAIYHGFLNRSATFALPEDFGMRSNEGNRLVCEALEEYIDRATQGASELNLEFRDRYAAFQNDDVEDDGPEQLTYDAVFGYVPSEAYDDTGSLRQ